jgi:hypothetical protein
MKILTFIALVFVSQWSNAACRNHETWLKPSGNPDIPALVFEVCKDGKFQYLTGGEIFNFVNAITDESLKIAIVDDSGRTIEDILLLARASGKAEFAWISNDRKFLEKLAAEYKRQHPPAALGDSYTPATGTDGP